MEDNKINDVLGNIIKEEEQKNITRHEKEAVVFDAKLDRDYQKELKSKNQLKAIKEFDSNDSGQREDLIAEQIELGTKILEKSVKKNFSFLVPGFDPYFRVFPNDIITPVAPPGTGKTTLGVNLALKAIRDQKRVLIITNETPAVVIKYQIACLFKRWNWKTIQETGATPQEQAFLNEFVAKTTSVLNVIGDQFKGTDGNTTTVEGVKNILEKQLTLPEDQRPDIIIVDYLQGILKSIEERTTDWIAQMSFLNWLNQFINKLFIPVILLGQFSEKNKSNKISFEDRLVGSRRIKHICSVVLEMEPHNQERWTKFIVRKNRHDGSTVGEEIRTSFRNGLYVEYQPTVEELLQIQKAEENKIKGEK